ncbi:MAG: DUF4129 domain-containing protein [Candidatus Dormibacteria bacterium]|jgi:hypothetical protein
MVAGSGDGRTGADRASGSASSRLRRGSVVILALAACLLLAVAVGARGSPGGALPLPATPTAWQAACYFLVGSIVGVGLAGLPIAVGIQRRRAAAGAYGAASWWQRLAAVALPIVLLVAIVAWWNTHPLHFGAGSPVTGPGTRLTPSTTALPPVAPAPPASPALILVAVLTGIVVAILVTLVLVMRSRRRPGVPPAVLPVDTPDAVAAVDSAIDALGAEVDPRRAVIAAYATMERLLGASGSPRRAADAPTEHLERSLVLLGAGRSAARRLTDLFERARFSAQVIDEPVRRAAFEALAAVRQDLEPA